MSKSDIPRKTTKAKARNCNSVLYISRETSQKKSKHNIAHEKGQYAYREDWQASDTAITLAEQE